MQREWRRGVKVARWATTAACTHVGLGRRLSGLRLINLVADLDVRVVTEDGDLLRQLTLDPTRDYERQGV